MSSTLFDFAAFFGRACPPGSDPSDVLEYLAQVVSAVSSDRQLGSIVRKIINVYQEALTNV